MSLSPQPRARTALLAAIMIAGVAGAYAWSLRGEFLWDDDLHITANPTIVGPLGLTEIWTSAKALYFPLVLTNFWVQHALWGLEPMGYRIVTLAWHIGAALLLWRVLCQLRVPGAWLGAALWALHPVQVESVAWICELKNTQSAVFFLASASAWICWLEGGERRGKFYWLALLCAVLAILSKPSTVMLPVALGLCVWWLRGRLVWRELVRLAPFFSLSAVAAGWTIWEQKFNSGAIGAEWNQTLPERFAIAGKTMWFYLGKLAWPEPLIFIYPRWDISGEGALAYLGVAAALAWGAFLLWRGREGRLRPVLLATAYFVALLFPVLGFFSVYFFRYSFVGDHFQYLASMGPLALLGAGLARLLPRRWPLIGGALVFALGLATARHTAIFHSSEKLWRDTVAKNPAAIMAWLNLADTFAQQQRHDEAIKTFRHALTLRPDDPYALNDLGCELTLIGQVAEAIPLLERSLAVKPAHPEALSNYGNALRAVGRSTEAIAAYRKALELKPGYTAALNNLGAELAESGKPAEALEIFETALRSKASDAGTLDNLGSTLRHLGRFDEAIARHQEALRTKPDFPEAHANLALTLVAKGSLGEALPHFSRAIALKPTLVSAYGHQARALMGLGLPGEAQRILRRAVDKNPESFEARLNMGTLLAEGGNPRDATPFFDTAARLAPGYAPAHLNLGNALAAQQRWSEAVRAFAKAVELQPSVALAHVQLAIALVNSQRLEEAVPHFEVALKLEARSEWHNQFGQVLRALGRNREAFEQFERAADAARERR